MRSGDEGDDPGIATLAALSRVTACRTSTGEPLGDVADLSARFGLTHLRAHYEVLPPGRRSSPAHRHTARDELVLVLSGRPSLERDGQRTPLAPGQVAAFAAGDAAHHAIVNASDGDATLLVVSAAAADDVVELA